MPLLTGLGHHVEAIDLPGHGEDRTPAWRISADDYAQAIVEGARRFDAPPVVVGHSMGGLAITRAVAQSPAAFAHAVYLCAFVPLGVRRMLRLLMSDRDTLISTGIQPGLFDAGMRADRTRAIFYGDCTDEDAAWATARLRPDPSRPVLGLLDRTPIPIPHTYVECTHDRAISIRQQRAMHREAGFRRIETLETDHSPFMSAPEELATVLDGVARAG